jgi:hypothetical protein
VGWLHNVLRPLQLSECLLLLLLRHLLVVPVVQHLVWL